MPEVASDEGAAELLPEVPSFLPFAPLPAFVLAFAAPPMPEASPPVASARPSPLPTATGISTDIKGSPVSGQKELMRSGVGDFRTSRALRSSFHFPNRGGVHPEDDLTSTDITSEPACCSMNESSTSSPCFFYLHQFHHACGAQGACLPRDGSVYARASSLRDAENPESSNFLLAGCG